MFVFWKYDLFPYVLHAEIEKENEDGSVVPKGYDMKIRNGIIKTDAEAARMIAELKELEEKREEMLNSFNEQARSIVDLRNDTH